MEKQNILTKKEELIMDILWKEPDPRVAYLTMEEIKTKMVNENYSVVDLSRSISTLQQKGYVDVLELEQLLYVPTKTREEYLVELIFSKGMQRNAVTKFFGKVIRRIEKEMEIEEAQKNGNPIKSEKIIKNVHYVINTYDERSEE